MTNSTRDVIIIGGGVSGLSAAYELEKQGIAYTLIEVKGRLGGSIITEKRDGFVMDGGAFAFQRPPQWALLDELGLADELVSINSPQGKNRVAFKSGTQTLTDTLADQLTNTVIQRMAVTSIGKDNDTYTVCLENGLALDARAVIVAIPARYAERLFRTLAPQVSEALMDYYYDHVTTVALGFDADNKPAKPPTQPPDSVFATLNSTDHPSRVPDGGMLVQAGLRVPLEKTSENAIVKALVNDMGWNPPVTSFVSYWHESHPLTVTGPAKALKTLDKYLPEGVALVGGCYQALELPQRTEAAQQAARAVVASLQS